jgi:hypothetical protein
LRLELISLTPGVLRMTGSTAALVSFEESSALLHELAGVEVSAKQVERAAEALGAEIAVDERGCVEKMGEVAPTMYLGMDGTGVPMRKSEVAGHAGKQPDGSAKTREAKLVTMWTAESRDEEDKPNEGKQWAAARCAELDDGKLHAIVHTLRPHAASSAEAAKCAMYIFHNRARMRYPKFHAQGLCTSTGILAAGCKVVIGTRLKRAGMHWTVNGANAIIALRCSKLSGRFEDFWERRSERAAA